MRTPRASPKFLRTRTRVLLLNRQVKEHDPLLGRHECCMRYTAERPLQEVVVESSDRTGSGLVAASALAALILLIVVLSANGAFAAQPMFPMGIAR